jgi:hypothetical protein
MWIDVVFAQQFHTLPPPPPHVRENTRNRKDGSLTRYEQNSRSNFNVVHISLPLIINFV